MTIAHYAIAGQAVESELPLPELESRPNGAERGGIQIRIGRVRPAPRRVVAQHRLEDGSLWCAVFGAAEGYLFHFPGFGVFYASVDGTEVEVFPESGIPPETLRHLLLDHVLPYSAPFWGAVVLHASGIATPRGALGFLGMSGTGKSTLAAAFARRGFGILSDDCLFVREGAAGVHVKPWYAGIRLWPDSLESVWGRSEGASDVAHYTRKKRVTPGGGPALEEPLRAIFLLGPPAADGGVRIERLSARDAAVELSRHAFYLDSKDHAGFRRFFDRVGHVAESVPLCRLSYPRSIEALDRVAEEVCAHAGVEIPALKA